MLQLKAHVPRGNHGLISPPPLKPLMHRWHSHPRFGVGAGGRSPKTCRSAGLPLSWLSPAWSTQGPSSAWRPCRHIASRNGTDQPAVPESAQPARSRPCHPISASKRSCVWLPPKSSRISPSASPSPRSISSRPRSRRIKPRRRLPLTPTKVLESSLPVCLPPTTLTSPAASYSTPPRTDAHSRPCT